MVRNRKSEGDESKGYWERKEFWKLDTKFSSDLIRFWDNNWLKDGRLIFEVDWEREGPKRGEADEEWVDW